MQKYVEVSKRDLKSKAENAWFETCRDNSIPFIKLKNKTKFSNVYWDYIAYSPEVDKVLNAANGQLRDGAIVIFKKYANSKSGYEANDLIVSFKNLENSKAKHAAEDLYDLIAAYLESNGSIHHTQI